MVGKASPLLCLCLAALALASAPRLFAEAATDEIHYDFFKHEDGKYRFDRVSGKLEKMIITADGVMWLEMPVVASKKGATAQAHKPAVIERAVRNDETTVSQINTEKRKGGPIDIFDEDNKKLNEDITDEDRKASLPDIARYEKDLSLMQNVKLSERINGAIVVRNKGDRGIQKLEVTLVVPVQDRPPVEFRFLFVDSGAANSPLQPVAGNQSISWFQKVDLETPAGSNKGNLDVKVTYIKLYDKAEK
jgi:hypothetical protein